MSSSDDSWVQAGPLRLQHVGGAFHQVRRRAPDDLILHRSCRERWHAGTGIHPTCATSDLFCQVLRGSLELTVADGEPTRLEQGGLAAVAAGTRYRLHIPGEDHALLVLINASGAVCRSWWRYLDRPQHVHAPLRSLRPAEQLLELLLQHLANPDMAIRWTALPLFEALLSCWAADLGGVHPTAPDPLMDRCHRRITVNPAGIESIASLAADCDLHPDTFTRRYRRRYGETPAAVLRRCRMEQACTWLARGGRSITAIAEDLGYADVFAFSKSFKSVLGCSPRQWRSRLHSG
ncbi:MAG: AraC family transcriptional regulator [Planctomycetota bacterium]